MFQGWKVVLGAGSGIAVGSAVFVSSSFALLSTAMGKEFGWTQSELALGASIVLLLQVFSYPASGILADRVGSRRAAMIAITGFSFALLFLSQVGQLDFAFLPTPRLEFYAAFFLIGLLAAGTNVVSYTKALTNWFDRKRGLALGLAAAFQAVGATVMPLVMHKMIETWGWQSAVVALAAFIFVICLPIVSSLVKDSPEPFGLHPDGDAAKPDHADHQPASVQKVGLVALLADPNFRKLAIAFSVMGFASYALVANFVFILTNTAKLAVEQVAMVQAVMGASILFGRIGFGWLLDRLPPAIAANLSIVIAACAFASYGLGGTFEAMLLTAVAAGAASGGESDLMPYLAGRYFGKTSVSTVFGWFLSAFAIGAALGPITLAQASTAFGGPSLPLYGIALLHAVPFVMFATLRRP